jgi:hypothetical protein
VLRHFEGWELGLVAVGIAALAAALFVPRGAEPDVFPVPFVDRKETARLLEAERARAGDAHMDILAYEVRAVGEAFRQYGRADADGDAAAASIRMAELRRVTLIARAEFGDPALSQLRAVQTLLFLAALERWESGGDAAEVAELGGAFLEKAKASGWLSEPRRLDMSVAERATLFRIRWVELTGLRSESAFAPSANEWRLYYRFLLEHPDRKAPADERLRYVAAAAKYDPSYPAALARGIIELDLGRPAKAVESLTAHLGAAPHGPWRLRAQNHLARALSEANALAPPQ